jgi:hypothetical protein
MKSKDQSDINFLKLSKKIQIIIDLSKYKIDKEEIKINIL